MIGTNIIPSISVEALIAARDRAVDAFEKAGELRREAVEALRPFGADVPDLYMAFGDGEHRKVDDPDYADARRNEIERHIWLQLFRLTNIDTIMDHRTRKELFDRLYKSRAYMRDQDDALPPLTAENVRETMAALQEQLPEFFEKCIEASYRALSWKHKTNEPGRIGEKLIVNGAFYNWGRSMQGDTVRLNHHEALHDLERVCLLIDGQAPVTHEHGLRTLGELEWGKWYDVPGTTGDSLLRIKVFRKGTTHVRITKRSVVDEMNRVMARRYPGAIPEPREAKERQQAREAKPEKCSGLTVKQFRQSLYTPDDIAELIAERADCCGWMWVLEPSAGSGQLVRAIVNESGFGTPPYIVAVENDPEALHLLRALQDRIDDGLMCVNAMSFFDMQPSREEEHLFDRIVMNPPFQNAREVEHVLHAWTFLKPGGKLLSVMSRGATTRLDGRYAEFRTFLEDMNATIEDLPPKAFAESGTNVATVLVTVEKPG